MAGITQLTIKNEILQIDNLQDLIFGNIYQFALKTPSLVDWPKWGLCSGVGQVIFDFFDYSRISGSDIIGFADIIFKIIKLEFPFHLNGFPLSIPDSLFKSFFKEFPV